MVSRIVPCLGLISLLTLSCGSDDDGESASINENGAGGGGTGGAGAGGAGVAAGGGMSGGGATGGNALSFGSATAGAGAEMADDTEAASTGCSDFVDPLPTGVNVLFQSADMDNFFGATFVVLGFDDNQLFVREGDNVKQIEVDGGGVSVLHTFDAEDYPAAVSGGKYIFKTENEDALVDVTFAPLSDPDTRTSVATLPKNSAITYGADYLFWEETEPQALWHAPWAGGGAAELVPEGNPLGMLAHEGYLYWLDFSRDNLARVAASGGEREDLVGVFFGGPMAAEGNDIYHSDTSLNSVERFTLGGTSLEQLYKGDVFNGPDGISVLNGRSYFLVGSFCQYLHTSAEPGGASMIVSGFDNAGFIKATPFGVIVADADAIYIVDLP